MKNPDPSPATGARRCGVSLGMMGRPNCSKNFSKGEPGLNENVLPFLSLSELAVFEALFIVTRTEMTAGFTLATKSAKPVGCCCIVSAAWADDDQVGRFSVER